MSIWPWNLTLCINFIEKVLLNSINSSYLWKIESDKNRGSGTSKWRMEVIKNILTLLKEKYHIPKNPIRINNTLSHWGSFWAHYIENYLFFTHLKVSGFYFMMESSFLFQESPEHGKKWYWMFCLTFLASCLTAFAESHFKTLTVT